MTRLGSPQGDQVVTPALSLTSCGYLVDLAVKNKKKKQLVCLTVTTSGSFKDLPGPASPSVAFPLASDCVRGIQRTAETECVASDSTTGVKLFFHWNAQ